MTAMSMMPVRLFLPPPIIPIECLGTSRKVCKRSCHCSISSRRCTKIRVFVFLEAIMLAAMTVLPNAVAAERTPMSRFRIALAAVSWRVVSVPVNSASIEVPDER
ncbi:hypothetical protein D3C73_848130 [compost metagenome]